jgi:hypothetical protein
MLRIEFEDPIQELCECCEATTTRLTRFVYSDNDAFAVYYAQFTEGHSEKQLSGIIGLGEWGDDSVGPEGRVAFPFRIWLKEDDFQVGLIDAVDSPWRDVVFLGRVLNREEALAHPWIKDVFHITDHMVRDDETVVRYFS